MTTGEQAVPATEFAPAKVNLTLHVTGQRNDGYHELESLVVFAGLGDRITVRAADRLFLRVTGPFAAGVPSDDDNLVTRAARLIGLTRADITLDKHLPPASGIGGGSADAAAFLRAVRRGFDLEELTPEQTLSLGADVPMCLQARAVHVSGIGEQITPVHGLPELPAVLVNPGAAVPTAPIFRTLTNKNGTGMTARPETRSVDALCDWLHHQRNDLEAPAIGYAPVIADVLTALRDHGASLARMSGSGATCFGLFDRSDDAHQAARRLARANPGHWVRATTLS